jgi:hypothetical protein
MAASAAAETASLLKVSQLMNVPGTPSFSSLIVPATPVKVQEPQSPTP